MEQERKEREKERIELSTSSERLVASDELEELKPESGQELRSHRRNAVKDAMLLENSYTHKTSLAVASFLISLLFAYLTYWSCSVPLEKSKWPSTTGVITSSEITGMKQRTLRIRYEFTIDGEKFSQPEVLDSMSAMQLPKGRTVVIRYNPLRHSDTVREPEINGATFLFGFISGIMMIFAFAVLKGPSLEPMRKSRG